MNWVLWLKVGEDMLRIAVDLDGTISEYPEFFRVFTKAMAEAGCKVYVITDRVPGTEAQVARELNEYGITYDVLKITAEKGRYVMNEGIKVLFDDRDVYFEELPEEVAVFKVRQKYNWDFGRKEWRIGNW